MKRIIPILMTLLLLSGCATQSAEKTYRQITMEEAITMMEEETGYIILDVRTAQEYSEKHIPGAINIANESILPTNPLARRISLNCRIKIS